MTTPIATAAAPDAPRLLDLVPGYEAYLIGEQRRPGGRHNYLKTVQMIFRWLGPDATNADLNDRAVRRYKEHLAAKGTSHSWVTNNLACIRDFCRWATTEGYRTDDPTCAIRRPPKRRPDPKPLYEQDLVALLHAIVVPDGLSKETTWYWRRNRLLILLMLYTGIRRMEAAALCWGDIHLDAGELRVRDGKNGNQRVIPIHPVLRVALAEVPTRERNDRTRPVIGTPAGDHVRATSLDHIFTRWLKDRGFELHAHLLRHTFASHLVWHDADLRTIQDLLGHAQLSTTEHYTKIDTRRKRTLLDRLPDFGATESEDV